MAQSRWLASYDSWGSWLNAAYSRSGSYSASVRALLPTMLASYNPDSNLPSRRWGATGFFKEAIAKNPEVKREIINGMANSLNRLKTRDGFMKQVDVNNIFETLRYVDMARHPENAVPILPAKFACRNRAASCAGRTASPAAWRTAGRCMPSRVSRWRNGRAGTEAVARPAGPDFGLILVGWSGCSPDGSNLINCAQVAWIFFAWRHGRLQ